MTQKILSHASAKKKSKTEASVSNFALLMVVFKYRTSWQ